MPQLGAWLRGLLEKEEPASGLPLRDDPTRLGGSPSFADDNNEFALAMYRQLRRQPGNLFFSPFSVRTALGMAQAGAAGETAAQMRKALCLPSADETRHVAAPEIVQRLTAPGVREYEIAVANSLWGQNGVPFKPAFLDLIARHYGGALNVVDFRRDAEAARVTINQWVEDATRQRIRELIPVGGLDAGTRLVLVNALYFTGTWELQFGKDATYDRPFHLEGGGAVAAPLMYQRAQVRHVEARGYQAVDLVFRGGDVSMLVILPDRQDGLAGLEKGLSGRMLDDCVARMQTREVALFLPRFSISWGTVNVSDHLTALGMPLAFSRLQANFSGIDGHEPPHEESLFISAVIHKAVIEMNEEGAEAAAATAVMTLGVPASPPSGRPPVPIFRADHPFLFAIRDRKSGAILFLGRMADPARGG